MDPIDLNSPEGVLAYYSALSATPQGQAAMRAQSQTAEMNIKIANSQMANQKAQIAIQKGEAAANAWYQKAQIKIAQQAHELAVVTQQQNNAIQAGQLTGTYNGQPTLANVGQTAQYTGLYNGAPTLQNLAQQAAFLGTYNGQPTLQAKNQEQQYGLEVGGLTGLFNGTPTLAAQGQQQQFGLGQGALTGEYNGAPTLAARGQEQQFGLGQGALTGEYQGAPTLAALQNAQQFGLGQAGVTGYYGGAPTLANQQFVTGATGYYGGAPTLAREQAAAGAALQAGQLGASLQGPGNWAQFLQAQHGIANSPVSALVASAPGGMGASAGPNPPPMTLASVLGGFGVSPRAGSGQVYAGGTPGFSEQTGQYTTGGAPGRSTDSMSGGYSSSSPVGAIGQVMNAPRLNNEELGLHGREGQTLQEWFNNPTWAPTGWWESKGPSERAYLSGLNSYWGGDPATFEARYRNSRPNQGAALAA